MGSITTKFPIFEWFKQDLTIKSPSYDAANVRTTSDEKPVDVQDRLGVIGVMDTLFSKFLASLIIFDGNSEADYICICVREHLAKLFIEAVLRDKREEPQNIALYHLAWLISRMVIDFALDSDLEKNFTKRGRLFYAGISSKVGVDVYRVTWKRYEKLIQQALLDEIDKISEVMNKYKKDTLRA
ncbi:hypothetical protein [Acinetobacter dispersus]|uniref:Uncharacterized protein n=1 Tax=Acinetobacter dispersus TaxID=70348 RepID=N9MTS2_9GAMM|nr:hypothetical protein [Acinetobacter dispersus]ENW93344.1 hypothetical protein F904_01468 [Acinetobacter dispersus]